MSDIAETAYRFTHSKNPEHLLKCPQCGQKSQLDKWEDCELPCELCGEHSGITCPKCGHSFDHVWDSEDFKAAQ